MSYKFFYFNGSMHLTTHVVRLGPTFCCSIVSTNNVQAHSLFIGPPTAHGRGAEEKPAKSNTTSFIALF
jgi:hypothetical protein